MKEIILITIVVASVIIIIVLLIYIFGEMNNSKYPALDEYIESNPPDFSQFPPLSFEIDSDLDLDSEDDNDSDMSSEEEVNGTRFIAITFQNGQLNVIGGGVLDGFTQENFEQIGSGILNGFTPANFEPQQQSQPSSNVETKNPHDYYKSLEKHEIDPQNVHTPEINKLLSIKYHKLLELNGKDLISDDVIEMVRAQVLAEVLDGAEKYIHTLSDTTAHKNIKMRRIALVLSKIREGNTISSISLTNPPREDDILTAVWLRIHSDDNKEVQKELHIALYDALLDCAPKKDRNHLILNDLIEIVDGHNVSALERKYMPVCINGRVARILGCLTILDRCPELSVPEKDYNEIANEAYAKAERIFTKAFDEFVHTPPISELYNRDESTLSNNELEAVKRFEKYVKDNISISLTNDYGAILSATKLAKLISSAQAAI